MRISGLVATSQLWTFTSIAGQARCAGEMGFLQHDGLGRVNVEKRVADATTICKIASAKRFSVQYAGDTGFEVNCTIILQSEFRPAEKRHF